MVGIQVIMQPKTVSAFRKSSESIITLSFALIFQSSVFSYSVNFLYAFVRNKIGKCFDVHNNIIVGPVVRN